MKTIVVVAVVIAIAAIAGGALLLSPNISQTVSNQLPISDLPQQQAQSLKPTVKDVVAAPSSYSGKSVEVEGLLGKDGLLSVPYLLQDGGASLSLQSQNDLDKYAGLKVRVTGIVRYNPQIFDASRTSIEIQSINPLDGEPAFFLEIIKNGMDDKGRPVYARHLIYDNSGTVKVYETKTKIILQTVVTKQRMDEIRNTLLSADIFSMQHREYIAEQAGEDRNYESYTYTVKVMLKVGDELRENKLTWPDPGKDISSDIVNLQAVINNIIKVDGQ